MSIPKARTEEGASSKLVDRILNIDHKKATKFIFYGITIAIIFGTIALVSRSISSNATNWQNYMTNKNNYDYWSGLIGYQEYLERSKEIAIQAEFMKFQVAIFANIARIGVNIGLLLVLIGFLGYSAQKEFDSRYRLISLIIAGVITVVMMFTLMFSNITVNIA